MKHFCYWIRKKEQSAGYVYNKQHWQNFSERNEVSLVGELIHSYVQVPMQGSLNRWR